MIEQINFVSTSWFQWMFSMFWQVSLLVIIISGIDLLIRNWAWPQVRYVLWILVLVKLVIPPSWTMDFGIISNIRSSDFNELSNEITQEFDKQRPTTEINTTAQNMVDEEKLKLAEKASPYVNRENIVITDASLSWKSYLMGGWIIGILIFAFALMHRISKLKKWHIEQEKRKNIPPWFHDSLVKVGKKLSIQRLPAIVFSDQAHTPAVYGIFRPVLLLPEKYIDGLSEEEAEHVLLHELTHVKRGDLIIHGICLILQIIYWFNPFLIWMRKQMKHVREICCDITIAGILKEKTKQYKDTLVKTARELLTETMEPGMGLLGLFEEPYQLISRLKWLKKESWKNRRVANMTAIILGILLTAFVLPMGEKINYPAIAKAGFGFSSLDNEKYRIAIEDINEEINSAFMNWEMDEIRKYYTEDAVVDQESRPTIMGLKNIMSDFRQQKASGVEFRNLENFIYELWVEEKNIHVIENFIYRVRFSNENFTIGGSGRSYTIWEKQDDDSLKIKYSIFNLENLKGKN